MAGLRNLIYREPNLVSQLTALLFAFPIGIALLVLSLLAIWAEPTLGSLAYGFAGLAVLLVATAEFLSGTDRAGYRARLRSLGLLSAFAFPVLLALAVL